jgi:PST family polysaccharide transporter
VSARSLVARGVRGRYGPVAIGRVVDQTALAVITLLLAARLEVSRFGVLSVLLLVGSLAATAADQGRALAILRLPAGGGLARHSVLAVRRWNALVVVAGGALALVVRNGDWRWVVAGAGLLWFAAAEASIGRSALIMRRQMRRLVLAEVGGAVIAVALFGLFGRSGAAAAMLLSALLVRQAALYVAARPLLHEVLDRTSAADAVAQLLGTQVLAYVIANIDYVLAGPILGTTAFGRYVLGYRAANVVPAQLSSAITPVALTELVDRSSAPERYQRLYRLIMLLGFAGSLLTVAVSPVLPVVIGERWTYSAWIVAALAFAVPFRLSLGLAGSMALSQGLEARLIRWELIRLVATATALGGAAMIGLRAFVAAVALVAIASHAGLHRAVCTRLGLAPPPVLVHLAAAACSVAVVAGPWWPQT